MSDRVRILCEDRRTERFLRRLCESHGIKVLDVEVAPSGEGASRWVLARYAGLVKQRRSKNFQQNLGLLVHIDGDNIGVQQRKTQLDARLAAAGVPLRGAAEAVAVLVPTWCIETWMLHLAGLAQPLETDKVKKGQAPSPAYRPALNALEAMEAVHVSTAVAVWQTLVTI